MHYAYIAALLLAVGDIIGTAFVAGCFGLNIGRRTLLFILLALVGVAIACLGIITGSLTLLFTLLVVAKVCSQSTCVLYVYTPEVFPTSIRVSGMMACSTVHRLAPVIAPHVIAILMKHSFGSVTAVFSCLYFAAAVSALTLSVE